MLRNQFVKKSRKNRISRKRQSKRGISRKLRVQQGGVTVQLIQLLLTEPIVEAITTRRPGFDRRVENFKMSKGEQGFKLSRMDGMMSVLNFDALLTSEPIEIKASMTLPNGTILYEIVNGRHRVARAIIEQRQHIEATILP
jgi:hypothetical protein